LTTGTTPQGDSRFKASLRRKLRRAGRFGWKGWLILLRRAAPWALLVFALAQIKTLSDKVRDVESREFQAVQDEVVGLRKDLVRMRDDGRLAERALLDSKASLKVVADAVEHSRRRAPELSATLDDATLGSQALRNALPASDAAARLKESLSGVEGQLAGVAKALPTGDTTGRLANGIDAACHRVDDIQARLPDGARITALTDSIDAQKKRLEALAATLPNADDAAALRKSIDDGRQAMTKLSASLPSADEMDALRRELAKVRLAVQELSAASKALAPATPAGTPGKPTLLADPHPARSTSPASVAGLTAVAPQADGHASIAPKPGPTPAGAGPTQDSHLTELDSRSPPGAR
jgi:hypothetical protein